MEGPLGQTGRLGLAERGRPAGGGAGARLRRGLRALVPPPPRIQPGPHGGEQRPPDTREACRRGPHQRRPAFAIRSERTGRAACLPPPGTGALSLEGSDRRSLPYIRAGKSWRLVREKISREGGGGWPEASPSSPPSSGGSELTATAGTRRKAPFSATFLPLARRGVRGPPHHHHPRVPLTEPSP